MGKYGYANQNYAYHNYGGHMPMTTPYGYSGANAYQGGSGSGMKIALAGGAGLLAGIAANKLMHHWGGYSREQLMNAPCSTGSWQGTCSSCVNQYGANNCNAMLSPKFNAARDDLMSTGFTPAQVQWPLQVRVTRVGGPEFNPMVICSQQTPGVAHPPIPQVFLTLTALQTYSNSGGGGGGYGGYSQYGGYSPGYEQTHRGGFIATLASSLLSCCCLCGLVAFCCVRKSKSVGDSSSSDDESVELSCPIMGTTHIGTQLLMVLLLTEMALDLWGQQHQTANIGQSIATESRKSALQISLWAHGVNAWLGRLCTSTRISGKTIPSTWKLDLLEALLEL